MVVTPSTTVIIRAARAILNSFPDVYIVINAHYLELRHKNPEYIIDGRLGDRKGIMSAFELSKYIARRKADFISGMMEACYIVFNGNAVVVNTQEQTRREIESFINELKP